jgi:glutamine synthetase
VNKLVSPPPEEQDCLEHQSTTIHTPNSLSEALDAFEVDTDFVEAIGSDFAAQFVATKRAEWEKFALAVTDWELKYYLPFI